jgi:hypothetical protein
LLLGGVFKEKFPSVPTGLATEINNNISDLLRLMSEDLCSQSLYVRRERFETREKCTPRLDVIILAVLFRSSCFPVTLNRISPDFRMSCSHFGVIVAVRAVNSEAYCYG